MEFDILSADWMTKLDGMWLLLKTRGADASRVCGMMDDGKEYVCTVSVKSNKRSRDANRYFWKLCSEIAKVMSSEKVLYTKEDIYRRVIKECGVWCDDEVTPDKVAWRRAAWEQIGTGWFTERVDFTPDGEKEIIRFYYGSSRYNTRQMSRLIDATIQDCKALGIETVPPDKLLFFKEES